MTDKFEINISPLEHYAKYKADEYTLAVIQFTVIKDGVRFDNGYDGRYECCDTGLKKLISAADDFLSGRITDRKRLNFVIPYIVGGAVSYSYFFDIIPNDHWVFNITRNFSSETIEIEYSCEIRRDQIQAMRDSLTKQVNEFDWENCGKTEYYTFSAPKRKYEWCYSARKLEKYLRERLIGEKLKKIYVSGTNFAEPLHVEKNFVYYYVGSRVYMEFENIHADILAHAKGLFEIRLFRSDEVFKERFLDTIEDGKKILCDTVYPFEMNYTDKNIMDVKAVPVEYWPWTPRGFDESKLGDPVELPEKIVFTLSNNAKLCIAGLDDDFSISMEQADL